MAKLPNKIYIVDPYGEDGNLIPNTEDVCWCADPVGDENIAYIAEQSVTDALAALRADLNAEIAYCQQHRQFSDYDEGVQYGLTQLDAIIAKLGLAPKEDNGTN